jgi:prepilin-type N-terminal cleavage/methylation domain-containing protein
MRPPRHRSRAFTLVELLLVLAIIGIVTAITVPNFVRSLKGNRLRTAARTVVSMGRYARSMAVMRQNDMALTFDLESSRVSVREIPRGLRQDDRTGVPGREPPAGFAGGGADPIPRVDAIPAPDDGEPGTGAVSADLARDLDRVTIAEVMRGGGSEPPVREASGQCTVAYLSNGTCAPYTVKLTDEDGSTLVVEVDALSSADVKLQ